MHFMDEWMDRKPVFKDLTLNYSWEHVVEKKSLTCKVPSRTSNVVNAMFVKLF